MCVSGEEEPGGSTIGSGGISGDIPTVAVYAPRLSLNMDALDAVDWDEVGRAAGISGLGAWIGAKGNIWGGVAGGVAGGVMEVESQTDTEDLFVIERDMILIPGMIPY